MQTTNVGYANQDYVLYMKEIFIYSLISLSSLIMLAYTVHMFIGGLVSERTEHIAMAVIVSIGAIAIGLLARDVVKRRRMAALQSTEFNQQKID